MMLEVRSETNRLFVNQRELLLPAANHAAPLPGHHHQIVCTGISPNEKLIISVDATGHIRVWDPEQDPFEELIWYGKVHVPPEASITAVSITDDGKYIAVAFGLTLVIYLCLGLKDVLEEIAQVTLPDLSEAIVGIQFLPPDRIMCTDRQRTPCTLRRQSAWVRE